ncbi:Cloroperoxidase [Dendrothele bispora CBS 962.96]|uniref:Cloroperoxidase n=1 Tax=Dendrothele bispora (strain CBS 962.96) TaxID=1314807 RepID=A0A4S8LMZ0_DENBC|nr:Cloroperoxidase [Dendrothele bispora CBS 962.96]
MAPDTNDLRGPCPGLNTLANHGFLPRDGKGLNVSIILDASLKGYNLQSEVIIVPAKLGLLTTNNPSSFTLDDIKLHGTIEHDASLSREDLALGDNVHFNETIFSTLANSNPGSDFYDVASAGKVQQLRLEDSETRNPFNNTNTEKEIGIRSGESALYLSVMGDPVTGKAPKEFVQIFFREERLPIAEGWHRPETPISLATRNPLVQSITEASNWTSSGGCPVIILDPSGDHF